LNSASNSTYRAAIIGCGRVAGGYDRFARGQWTVTHAGAYRFCTRTDLVAAADISPDVLSTFGKTWGVEHLYADYQEMLAREQPDIVSICLPPGGHFKAFRAACEAGARAIFLEKPIAHDLEEARRMPALAGGRPVAVNYFRRWNPTLRTVREDLRRGNHGCPRRVTVHYVKGLVGNGSHFVDLLRWFFGEPVKTQPFRLFGEPQEDPAADFEMLFADGLVATFLHIPRPDYVLQDLDIFTDRARLIIGQRGQKILRFLPVEEPHYRMFPILRLDGRIGETQWRNCSLRAVEELIACLEGGGVPSCTLEDGLRTLEICRGVLSESLTSAGDISLSGGMAQ
jgi:predicted dehydrogenase